ncbi:hypothetical protein BB561_000951 [Smittium simulii]|uniref:CBS domain-containing protein n=1 Tax=Smittium simulii TaxID=133385 RepID=A0A2T9YWV2_9FUNG|nr:hypothetical protein BB561_000951 [Smittium simulii]
MEHTGLSSIHDWETIQVSGLVSCQDLIQIDTTSTAEEACLKLIKNSISSIPLYDKNNKSYLGLFDLNDLVKHIYLCISKSGTNTPTRTDHEFDSFYSQKRIQDFSKIKNKAELYDLSKISSNDEFSFLSKNVLKLSDISTFDPFYAVLPETTLMQVIDVFASRLHRVAVMCDGGCISGILSQSTVNKFLVQFLQHFGSSNFSQKLALSGSTESLSGINPNNFSMSELMDSLSWNSLDSFVSKSLIDHKLDKKIIWAVSISTPVLSALYLFQKHQFSSLLIIGSENVTVGSISISDIKYLVMPEFRSLIGESCLELLQKIRQYQGIVNSRDSAPIFSVNATDSLKSVMVKIAATGSHRIWVTSKNLPSNNFAAESGSVSDKRNRKNNIPHCDKQNPITSEVSHVSQNSENQRDLFNDSLYGDNNSPYTLNFLDHNGVTLKLTPPTFLGNYIIGVVSLTDVFKRISSLTVANNDDCIDFTSMN